jgi:hypothetical protein
MVRSIRDTSIPGTVTIISAVRSPQTLVGNGVIPVPIPVVPSTPRFGWSVVESIGNGECSINRTFPRIDFPTLLPEVALHKRQVIADNIRRLIMRRIKLGEFSSIEHFASSTGVPKSLLSRILNLKADPKLSSLDKIAVALEVPVEELLREKSR